MKKPNEKKQQLMELAHYIAVIQRRIRRSFTENEQIIVNAVRRRIVSTKGDIEDVMIDFSPISNEVAELAFRFGINVLLTRASCRRPNSKRKRHELELWA